MTVAIQEPICIPYAPRPLQVAIHASLDTHRFAAVVCHRRFGKTVLGVNHLQKCALTLDLPRPRFAYLAPTYTQGKAVAWDYIKHYAGPLPHEVNESELRIDYPNGGQVRIFGADNPDSLRGLYFDGVVLDEFGLMPPRIFSEVVRPLLTDRQGWALFIGTPNGKNQFYDVIQQAKDDSTWYHADYKASQTRIIPQAELQLARASMTQDEYNQEFECSFEASVKGAIYARELQRAREDDRITRVPYDPALVVDTDWDLGVGDATAIWFSQSLRSKEMRLIDYYEASSEGLPHFKGVLNQKGYTYGQHWAPHDIQVREFTSGQSRFELASQLGIHFAITPRNQQLEDGIHAARMLFPRCWFDADKCRRGLEALQGYRWTPRDTLKNPTGKPLPVHDWSSHGADAFRGLASRWYQPSKHIEAQTAKEIRKAQLDRDEPFHWTTARHTGRGGY